MPTATSTFVNDSHDAEPYEGGESGEFARLHIRRTLSGDLEGTAVAELLAVTASDGSAAYVGLDTVTGRLDGREGSFVVQHWGTVSPDGATTGGSVVPGSGTGGLAGLRGQATITVAPDGTHTLTLEYEL